MAKVKKSKPRCEVPMEYMVPIGVWATKEFGTCADTWSDSQLALLRSKLPPEYHAVPTDYLGKWWRNIRKNGTEGYKVNGNGPAKGSRKKTPMEKSPKWYRDYLKSEDWQIRREQWLIFWGRRCSVCNAKEDDVILDVHHRTYIRLRQEAFTDCTVLCRSCHRTLER